VPSEKRARQRAGREQRKAEEEKKAKRSSLLRRGAIIAAIAVVVIGSIILFTHNSSKSTTASTTTTTAASTTTTGASSAANAAAQAQANKVSVAAGCPASPSTRVNTLTWSSAPPMTIDTSKIYTAVITTDLGPFTVKLDPSTAPKTVNNFVFLAKQGYYRCVIFHRVIPGFMDQTGDPTGTGTGGPGYTIPDELPKTASPQYPIGSLAMANTGQANTGGSQFFIVAGPEGESLPPSYALFGQVVSGNDIVEKINAQGSTSGVPPAVTHRILSVKVTES
jgi:cyclophilin family peptidyl-prolyl cis-trans isomerase